MYLLPQPRKMKEKTGCFTVTYKTPIVLTAGVSKEAYRYAKLLQQDIEKELGYVLPIRKVFTGKEGIVLQWQETAAFGITDEKIGEQAYTLDITGERIVICAGGNSGLLNGIQTLRQMIALQGAMLQAVEIWDAPALEARAYYMDVTRSRIPTVEYCKKVIDRLSYYKINQFQMYIEHSFLFSEFSEVWRDDTPLTPEDILELDEYCRSLNIEMVPSVASFGHLYKVLRTKSYSHLCELDDLGHDPFSFHERMAHHTLNICDEESIGFVRRMLEEYIPLFTSDKFNICADETFDLGKGKSRQLAEEIGTDQMYVDFLNKVFDIVMEHGKTPMFWGDIIVHRPESYKQIPPNVYCLNWNYAVTPNTEDTRKLQQAGAVQYLCPGVQGWRHLINAFSDAYENIISMCQLAHETGAAGMLNTDWGDYGHMNHPEFSTIGIIYGAAAAWNTTPVSKEEYNRSISILNYKDPTGSFVDIVTHMSQQESFAWWQAVNYMEEASMGVFGNGVEALLKEWRIAGAEDCNQALEEDVKKLYALLGEMDSSTRSLVQAYVIMAEGQMLLNRLGAFLAVYHETDAEQKVRQLEALSEESSMQGEKATAVMENPATLAAELECWLYQFKQLWRSVSRESELRQNEQVFFWYADFLRSVAQ